jgi:hypothetical protein
MAMSGAIDNEDVGGVPAVSGGASSGCLSFDEIVQLLKGSAPAEMLSSDHPPSLKQFRDFYEILYRAWECGYKIKDILRAVNSNPLFVRRAYVNFVSYRNRGYIGGSGRKSGERQVVSVKPAAPPVTAQPSGAGVSEVSEVPTESLQEPPAAPEEILGQRIIKYIAPIISKYFGKEADRLTAEYIANIFAVGAMVEQRYAPWCIENGKDRVSCVVEAMEFYKSYRDVVPELEGTLKDVFGRYSAALSMVAGLLALDDNLKREIIRAEVARLLVSQVLSMDVPPEHVDRAFYIVERYVGGGES